MLNLKVIDDENFGHMFWQLPPDYAQMQPFQILFPAHTKWRIPESRFVYISHITQPNPSNNLVLTGTIDIAII